MKLGARWPARVCCLRRELAAIFSSLSRGARPNGTSERITIISQFHCRNGPKENGTAAFDRR